MSPVVHVRTALKGILIMNRRNLRAIPALAAIQPAAAAATHRRPRPPRRIIATEEGFALPEDPGGHGRLASQNPTASPASARFAPSFGPAQAQRWFAELADLGDVRERAMSEAGITTQLLLHGSPGVQIFDAAEGTSGGDGQRPQADLARAPAGALRAARDHRTAGPDCGGRSSNERCGPSGCTAR